MKRGRAYDEGNQGEAYNPDYLYGGENYHKALSDVVSYVLRSYAGDGLSVLSDVVVKVTNALVAWVNLSEPPSNPEAGKIYGRGFRWPKLKSIDPVQAAELVFAQEVIRMVCVKETVDKPTSEGVLAMYDPDEGIYREIGDGQIDLWCQEVVGAANGNWKKNFDQKQRELEASEQDAPAPEVIPDVPETAEPAEQPSADSAIDVYDLDRSDVYEMASDLQKAHIHRSREAGKPFMDERYERLVEARNHPDEQLAKLREDVDAARREFHASKEALDTLQHPCPGLLAGMHVFAKAGCNARDPVSRMMADMTAMMLRMMIKQVLDEEARRQREVRLKHERMQRRVKEAERRAPVRTPRSADKDKQFGE